MQKSYFKSDELKKRQVALKDVINDLIRIVKNKNGCIINVRTEHSYDTTSWTLNMLEDDQGFLQSNSDEVENIPGLNIDDAIIITKTRDSAFYDTDLKATLEKYDIHTVILCGVSTHSCIMQTASDAYAANFKVILAKDGIADDKPQYVESSLRLLEEEYRQLSLSNDQIKSVIST